MTLFTVTKSNNEKMIIYLMIKLNKNFSKAVETLRLYIEQSSNDSINITQNIYTVYKGFVNLTVNKKFFLEFPIKIRGILNFRQPVKSGCFTERAIDL